MRALALDVGSSSIRCAVVDETGLVSHVHQRALAVHSPAPGVVEYDARQIAAITMELARATDAVGSIDVVGVTNQRATTVVFDQRTGQPVGPALSWQDLRTIAQCLELQREGVHLAPNQTATKAAWLLNAASGDRSHLRVATLDAWITWHLSGGADFITDRSNACLTGLVTRSVDHWDAQLGARLGVDVASLPTIVNSYGDLATATTLTGRPQITAIAGDQPASTFGQSCVTHGTKITFGTAAVLDAVTHDGAPQAMRRFESGCYPTVLRSNSTHVSWGVEAIELSAGLSVAWLRDGIGILDDLGHCEQFASSVDDSDGVTFVPALNGLGTPQWDFGARGAFFGLTRGTRRPHLIRAVLEGVAQRGVDLVEASVAHTLDDASELRVDGAMCANQFFVQRFADFLGRPVAVSSELEATTRGIGLMALVGAGHLSLDDVASLWRPRYVVEPRLSEDERATRRAEWVRCTARASRTIPEFSEISF